MFPRILKVEEVVEEELGDGEGGSGPRGCVILQNLLSE
jgi:hypothetical protein